MAAYTVSCRAITFGKVIHHRQKKFLGDEGEKEGERQKEKYQDRVKVCSTDLL